MQGLLGTVIRTERLVKTAKNFIQGLKFLVQIAYAFREALVALDGVIETDARLKSESYQGH